MPPRFMRRDGGHPLKLQPMQYEEPVPEPEPEPVEEEVDLENILPTSPMHCVVKGMDIPVYVGNAEAQFQIEAFDEEKRPQRLGGDIFFVSVRGPCTVRARVHDQDNGMYHVTWTPNISGTYQLSLSLFGVPLTGSPYTVSVHDPAPFPAHCEASGESLYRITARRPSIFEIRFRDRAQRICQAVDLDVFVVPIPDEATCVGHTAWDVATQAPVTVVKETIRLKGPVSDRTEPPDDYGKPNKATKARRKQGDGGFGQPVAPPVKVVTAAEQPAVERPPSPPGDHDEMHLDLDLVGKDQVARRSRAFAIQVLSRPLYVFRDARLQDGPIAILQPEQLATVLEEHLLPDGEVRARLPPLATDCRRVPPPMVTDCHLSVRLADARVRDVRRGAARCTRVASQPCFKGINAWQHPPHT